MSGNAGGLIRWPAMVLLPLGFALVLLQGVSEIVKRIGWLARQGSSIGHCTTRGRCNDRCSSSRR